MVNVIQQCLAEGDNDSAIKGFELFDGLLLLVCKCNSLRIHNLRELLLILKNLQETPLLSDHFQQLIEFVLIVSRNNQYDDSVRVMALQFLIWVAS